MQIRPNSLVYLLSPHLLAGSLPACLPASLTYDIICDVSPPPTNPSPTGRHSFLCYQAPSIFIRNYYLSPFSPFSSLPRLVSRPGKLIILSFLCPARPPVDICNPDRPDSVPPAPKKQQQQRRGDIPMGQRQKETNGDGIDKE